MRNDLSSADEALRAGKPADAVAHLAAWVSEHPSDRESRLHLGIALGDAGHPEGALQILRALAGRLAHQGYLLAAMAVIKRGLKHAPDDPSLLTTLRSLHVRGVRAKAGDLPMPPPLKSERGAEAVGAEALLALRGEERLARAAAIGTNLGPAGATAIPLPLPLFCELDPEAFVETFKRLQLSSHKEGSVILREGEAGDSLLIVVSGHVEVSRDGASLAKLGPGMVIGEMALITGAPRSATVIAHEDVEVFTLERKDVEALAAQKPEIAEELMDYCRNRLIGNVLNTSPLFKHFDTMARYTLIERFSRKSFQPGQRLIEEGQSGTGLFVIASGEAQVSVKREGENVIVATLKPGEVAGEIALLNDQPTTATVTAAGRVGALFLPRDEFQKILAAHPQAAEYLKSLSADRLNASRAAREATEVTDASELIVL
jgi:CRP-like cAMP-binding protein